MEKHTKIRFKARDVWLWLFPNGRDSI
jgi:hypothetical protein